MTANAVLLPNCKQPAHANRRPASFTAKEVSVRTICQHGKLRVELRMLGKAFLQSSALPLALGSCQHNALRATLILSTITGNITTPFPSSTHNPGARQRAVVYKMFLLPQFRAPRSLFSLAGGTHVIDCKGSTPKARKKAAYFKCSKRASPTNYYTT